MQAHRGDNPITRNSRGPAARHVLASHDLPRAVITIFTADAVPEQLVIPSGARLVRFGRSREGDLVCLALDDLSICEVDAEAHEMRSTINTSLSAFIAFLGVCENGYPFALHGGDYDDDDVYDDPESLAADTVHKAFEELDPTVLDSGRFWDWFLSDVRSGDHCD
ncbi:SUKH-4 family immunity protein [Catellatospora coxensis]|uniref:SUKH-4 family immunity protein n=1 Tax=Catellatospora coxensis TaxID=310354 RepID=UPI0019449AF9|nr:SUKH-4 family immunity protein [Catellatospora coxensis]